MHAYDGGIDHLHRRVMTGGQRIHDPIPDASLPPTNEAVVASGAGAIGFRQNIDAAAAQITVEGDRYPQAEAERTQR